MRIIPLTRRLPTEWLPGIERLTPTERQTVDLMCAGLTNAQTARVLKTSENSVKCAAHQVYNKLNVSNQHQLMALIIAAIMPEDD